MNPKTIMIEKAFLLLKGCILVFVLLPVTATAQIRGHIDVSAEKCLFKDAIYLFDTPIPRTQKSVGILQDGAKVIVTKTSNLKAYYLVEGDDADGATIHGYAEKGCVVIEESERVEIVDLTKPRETPTPPPPPPPPVLHSGFIVVYPLDLGEKYDVMIGDKSGTCTAMSIKELSCDSGLPDFQGLLASQGRHEFLLGCQFDGYETCANLPPGQYNVMPHGRSVTVRNSGMERINSKTGKRVAGITPVFSILAVVK